MATPAPVHQALPHERQRALEERSKSMACDLAAAALGYEERHRVTGESVSVLTGALIHAAVMSAVASGGTVNADDLLWMAIDGIQKGREKLAEKRARSAG